MSDFRWYHVNGDGTADVFKDSPEIAARVDNEPHWYGSAEGPILHGGVLATAFRVKTECVYVSQAWLDTRKLIPAGMRRTVTITARPAA